jgi:hypothetical protein
MTNRFACELDQLGIGSQAAIVATAAEGSGVRE